MVIGQSPSASAGLDEYVLATVSVPGGSVSLWLLGVHGGGQESVAATRVVGRPPMGKDASGQDCIKQLFLVAQQAPAVLLELRPTNTLPATP